MAFELKSSKHGEYQDPPVAASTKINVGCPVVWNGSGYAVEGGHNTLLCPEFIGIATHTADNSSGSAGDMSVHCIPINEENKFSVKTFTGTSLAQSHCGLAYDVNDVSGSDIVLDLTDTTFAAKSYGFVIEEVLVAGDKGTAKGHFVLQGAFD